MNLSSPRKRGSNLKFYNRNSCLRLTKNKMRLIFIPILLIFISIIFGGHFFVYYTIIKLFNITSPQTKLALLITAAILSFTLILSMTLARITDFFIVRWFYILIVTWHGLLVNLFLASSFAWLIFLSANFLKISLNTIFLLAGSFFLAVIISIYGIWNAQHPQIKNINVKINNLPAAWQNKKIVFISDIHLGAVNKAPFIGKIVDQINSVNPELVLIGGDYYDGSLSTYNSLADPLKKIKSKYGTYFINGNHETYIGEQGADQALRDAGVKILKDEAARVNGINILGAEFTSEFGNKEGVEKILSEANPGEINILLYHEPRFIKEAKEKGINLQLAGHTHKGQQYPFNFFTWLIYKKYHDGLNTEGNYNIYTSNGAGTWGPPMRIGNAPEIVVILIQ